jgi:hypothetical protein
MRLLQILVMLILLNSAGASPSRDLGDISYEKKIYRACRTMGISADGISISSRDGSLVIPLDKAPTRALSAFTKQEIEFAKNSSRAKQATLQAAKRSEQEDETLQKSFQDKYPNYSRFIFKVEENLQGGAVGRKVKRVPYSIPSTSSSLGRVGGGGFSTPEFTAYSLVPEGGQIYVEGLQNQKIGETLEIDCNKNGFYQRSIGGNGTLIFEKWEFLSAKK